MNKEVLLNILVVLVARTWERVRLSQPHEEMPKDNIESIGIIIEIASRIYNDPNIVSNATQWWYIYNESDTMSDCYVERQAVKIIESEYIY
jgi:hypothetical protein